MTVLQEAETNLIELKFGEENLLEDMIEFLYKGDFDYAPDDVETSCICPKGCCKHGAVYYAHLYVMAGTCLFCEIVNVPLWLRN